MCFETIYSSIHKKHTDPVLLEVTELANLQELLSLRLHTYCFRKVPKHETVTRDLSFKFRNLFYLVYTLTVALLVFWFPDNTFSCVRKSFDIFGVLKQVLHDKYPFDFEVTETNFKVTAAINISRTKT